MANDPLILTSDFNMLEIADLIRARDLNHARLIYKQNVLGTAIGRYLIRKSDPWPTAGNRQGLLNPQKKKGKRTLDNSEVRAYSWPCVLVFVEKWEDEDALSHHDFVPDALYLDDHRVVPVCVVEAPMPDRVDDTVGRIVFPDHMIGGGYPVISEVQNRRHVASIGCLVTDGHKTYALTNRHVAGGDGDLYTLLGGEKAYCKLGKAAKGLTRMPFSEVYPGLGGKDVYVNLDAGLIEIEDLNCWTTMVFQIGMMGPLADVGVDNLTLRLIDCRVKAYGCASGKLEGLIKALFYRYKSVGGFEYVADFLIGPKEGAQLPTRPGDSGTVWLLEQPEHLPRPIALQWGGHEVASPSGKSSYRFALATNLTTICNQLEVDVVRDWNVGTFNYWGEMGHYTIGAMACSLTSNEKLRKLMLANADRIGFNDPDLSSPDKYEIHAAHYPFVPLADVADNVWRTLRPQDANNHFADMDAEGAGKYASMTLMEMFKNDPTTLNPHTWLDFYSTLDGTNPGSLPFRVWEIYEQMVSFLRGGDVISFFCAAGCLAHYVGDACQPLHISKLHHGYTPAVKNWQHNVHSVYETQMLNENAEAVVTNLRNQLKDTKSGKVSFTTGFGAAKRTVELMQETIEKILAPQKIVDAYNAAKPDRASALWDQFADETMHAMAEGCRCLADIWESAWAEGDGDQLDSSELVQIPVGKLSTLYRSPKFLPSRPLDEMADGLMPGTTAKTGSRISNKKSANIRVRVKARATAPAANRERTVQKSKK